MPAERLPMRKVREVLRLKYACGASERVIARSLGIGRTAVGGIHPAGGGDRDHLADPGRARRRRRWNASCSRRPATTRRTRSRCRIGTVSIAELRRRGVTLALLWEEYRAEHPDGYGYSRFCDLYGEWRRGISATMRQTHAAGEKLFVDFAGDTVPVFDALSGEVTRGARSSSRCSAHRTTPTRKRAGARGCRTGSAPTSTPSPFSAGCRRRSSATTSRPASPPPAATSRASTAPTRISPPITARPSCRRGRASRATRPRSKSRC